jgi:GNAT superfamily N-acetyltransferase
MNVTLHTASLADATRIADILIASRAVFLPYAPSPHSDASVRAWVRDVLLPRERVTVATLAGQQVGVLAMHHTDGIGWITQLYLDPPNVGRGIGSLLLAHALAELPRPIRLFAFQQNHGARRFYERNGFVPVQFTDGSGNEEHCPDVLYQLDG